jgi:hypothetical protein
MTRLDWKPTSISSRLCGPTSFCRRIPASGNFRSSSAVFQIELRLKGPRFGEVSCLPIDAKRI